ncbi:uncharacterized protein EHS24_001021 [Apiotrichum porosum]|uniref:Integral membrane protein n=1 Tax=Apiotrichum porosum TaxID=105984 RepID=A0A427YBP1_9TREE|nr:uncharacterized protein EHS24_001021 [Apiotrichum porosum]RSH88476.1 hypothetical protein EHS24_001021 [Apiotrichum porosum]
MSSTTGVSTLIAGMFLTGCANSLLTKYQDKLCVENCDGSGPRIDFEQPVYQTLNMFIGEFLCVLPLLWNYLNAPTKGRPSYLSRLLAREGEEGYSPVPAEADDDDDASVSSTETQVGQTRMRGFAAFWLWFPAFFDICGTTLMNVGLILTPVSIYQMSRGALVLWVGLLSVLFLRRHLFAYQWASLVVVTLGVCLVGLAGTLVKKATIGDGDEPADLVTRLVYVATSTRAEDDPAKVALGVALILFAQIFTASQYVIEEKIMSHYTIEPLAAVTLEGMFGGLTTLIGMPILHLLFANKSPYFDVPRGWHQIVNNPAVMWASFAIALSIGAFNFFGLSVTSRVSATTRSTIDTCRTLGIWIVSLLIGWETLVWPYSLLQITGFGMLVYGTFVYNGLLQPIFFTVPPAIQLPEDEDPEIPIMPEHT